MQSTQPQPKWYAKRNSQLALAVIAVAIVILIFISATLLPSTVPPTTTTTTTLGTEAVRILSNQSTLSNSTGASIKLQNTGGMNATIISVKMGGTTYIAAQFDVDGDKVVSAGATETLTIAPSQLASLTPGFAYAVEVCTLAGYVIPATIVASP